MDDALKKKKEDLEYLEEQLKRAQQIHASAPVIQQRIEQLRWEIGALSNRPPEADEISWGEVNQRAAWDSNSMRSAVSPLPEYDPRAVFSWYAATTSSGSAVFANVSRLGSFDTPRAQSYSFKYTDSYKQLQASQDRLAQVRQHLEKLADAELLARFNKASQNHMSAKAGIKSRTEAALAMRNLLDGLQGVLFNRARKWDKENMAWPEMAKRLVLTPGGYEEQTLVDQETKRNSLISQLSDVMKEREGNYVANLDDIWTLVLDHIYVVLGLIGL